MAILAPPEGLTPTQGHKFGNFGKRPHGHPNDASFVPRGVRIKKNDFWKLGLKTGWSAKSVWSGFFFLLGFSWKIIKTDCRQHSEYWHFKYLRRLVWGISWRYIIYILLDSNA